MSQGHPLDLNQQLSLRQKVEPSVTCSCEVRDEEFETPGTTGISDRYDGIR